MKIGFVRLSSTVELNLSSASVNTLGTELRVGLLKALVDAGHTVTIYSGIKNADLALIKNRGFTQNWYNKLKYEPMKYPKDEDILLIEQGTDNVRFAYFDGEKEISFIKRTFDCISNYSGNIIYYQHGCLPFPFETKDASVETVLNLRNLNKRSELWKDKFWTIWHHFTNFNEYLPLSSYEPFVDKLNFKYTMLPYSDIEPWYNINPKPQYDSLFIGAQWDSRSVKQGFERTEEVRKLYDIKGLNNAIMGKWEDKGMKDFKHVKFLGITGKHGDAYRYWNDSYTCIYTTSKYIKKAGLLPTRLTMANRGGSILLLDTTCDCAKILSDDWVVTTQEDVKNKINLIKGMSVAERDSIRKKQLYRFPKWDKVIGEII